MFKVCFTTLLLLIGFIPVSYILWSLQMQLVQKGQSNFVAGYANFGITAQ